MHVESEKDKISSSRKSFLSCKCFKGPKKINHFREIGSLVYTEGGREGKDSALEGRKERKVLAVPLSVLK